MKKIYTLLLCLSVVTLWGQEFDYEIDGMECTTITVGKKASADGSVMTSHTDDSGRSRTNIMVEPAADRVTATKRPAKYRRWHTLTSTSTPPIRA